MDLPEGVDPRQLDPKLTNPSGQVISDERILFYLEKALLEISVSPNPPSFADPDSYKRYVELMTSLTAELKQEIKNKKKQKEKLSSAIKGIKWPLK